PARLHLCLPEEGRRCLRRPVGRPRGDGQGGTQRQDTGGADRDDQGPVLPATRPVRQRRPCAESRAGEPARGRAQEARQDARVPPLRRGRPRLLLLAPAALPARAGDGRLEQGVRLLRQASGEVGGADMCTSIIEIARADGMAKRGDEWFPLTQAVVAYDHARHAPLGDVITLDFINTGLEPGARAGIELTLETAKELRAALDRAIAAAEFEEAEVTGQGAVPSVVRAA